jgi:hypothetical protein
MATRSQTGATPSTVAKPTPPVTRTRVKLRTTRNAHQPQKQQAVLIGSSVPGARVPAIHAAAANATERGHLAPSADAGSPMSASLLHTSMADVQPMDEREVSGASPSVSPSPAHSIEQEQHQSLGSSMSCGDAMEDASVPSYAEPYTCLVGQRVTEDEAMEREGHARAKNSSSKPAAVMGMILKTDPRASATSPRGVLPLPDHLASNPTLNIVQQLFARQHHPDATAVSFRRMTYAQRFGRLKLQRTLDTRAHSASDSLGVALALASKRSKISEIVAADDLVFVLTFVGVCLAYDRTRGFKLLCFLNVIADEVIRSLFYNRLNCSLITVSVYRHDNFTSLRCRTTTLTAIAAGKPEQGVSLFTSESLQWPGFVEFDDVNKKILTFSASSSIYKVWDLATYDLRYQLSDRSIDEVKISPGIMLLIHQRDNRRVPLRIISIDTGELLQAHTHTLQRAQKVLFIEQFNEKLLIKQKRTPLHMIDVADRWRVNEVAENVFPTPVAFIFLYENALFLTFTKRMIAVWNFAGQRVATFEDHDNWSDPTQAATGSATDRCAHPSRCFPIPVSHPSLSLSSF